MNLAIVLSLSVSHLVHVQLISQPKHNYSTIAYSPQKQSEKIYY